MNKELLEKYLNNSCSKEEFEELVFWVKEEALKKDSKSLVFNDWKLFEPDRKSKKNEKYDALLNKIHHQINLKKTSGNEVSFVGSFKSWLSRAAAILFIPLLGFLVYILSNNNMQLSKLSDQVVDSLEVIAPIGSRTVVQLSDGTEVNLNYGSKIKYPRVFKGDKREVILSGEGYFDVAHNPDNPFIVKTQKLNIKALGTKFNVNAYHCDDVVSTTLVEGKVVIEKVLPGKKVSPVGVLTPGQHIAYNLKSGSIYSEKGNVDKYIAWKEGKLIFDNEPLTIVAERLERIFNVEIELEDNIKDFTYTVTFVNDPLYLILDLMTETTPITYKILPRKKLVDETYAKQKIRIEKRIDDNTN